jgi:hypothetical protein
MTEMTSTMLMVGAGAVAAFFLVRRVLVCRHPGPLGLLPPVADGEGGRTPARWYCDTCGKSWAAGFKQEARVIQRFTGYDESKAVASAKRADELERRQRSLAVGRAGVSSRPRSAARLEQDREEPVPIHGRRLAG